MASLQQSDQDVLAILQNEDKAVVEQMMKEAESVLFSEVTNVEKMKVKTAGCVLNLTNKPQGTRLQIHSKHDWSGQVSVRALHPPEIPVGGTAKFVHNGAFPKGSKAALVYASVDTAWLLAWSVPINDDQPNKVYIEDGSKESYKVMNWDEIERKLEASGDTSLYEDSSTGSKAIAKISHAKKATLGAMFLN